MPTTAPKKTPKKVDHELSALHTEYELVCGKKPPNGQKNKKPWLKQKIADAKAEQLQEAATQAPEEAPEADGPEEAEAPASTNKEIEQLKRLIEDDNGFLSYDQKAAAMRELELRQRVCDRCAPAPPL